MICLQESPVNVTAMEDAVVGRLQLRSVEGDGHGRYRVVPSLVCVDR